MSKRTLSEIADVYIDALRKIGDDDLARELKTVATEVDTALHNVPPKSRMGRHARAAERLRQGFFDLDCYLTTVDLHREGMTWTAAHEQVGQELHVSAETVRKAFSRGKRVALFIAERASDSKTKSKAR